MPLIRIDAIEGRCCGFVYRIRLIGYAQQTVSTQPRFATNAPRPLTARAS
jgi:hypothetical protein